MPIALIAGLYLVLFALGITCPIKYLTGISCPGCGMSRACLNALRLDFEAAFAYHPLWPALLPVLCLLLVFHLHGFKKSFSVLLALSVIALLAVYCYRLWFTESTVVVFDWQNGAILRLLNHLHTLLFE